MSGSSHIFIICSPRARVGKTLAARLVAEFYAASARPVVAGESTHVAKGDLNARAAALERMPRTRMIDECASHHLSSHGEELCAVLPVRALLSPESQPRLVYERGRLERVTIALASQDDLCLSPKLRVDESNERIARLRITSGPRAQQLGHRLTRLTSRGRRRRGRTWDDLGWRGRHDRSGLARRHRLSMRQRDP